MPVLCSALPSEPLIEAPLLQIELIDQPSGTILRCIGEIDVSNVDRLEEALTASIIKGKPEVEIDLRQTEYLDGAALRALLRARYRLAQEGRALIVTAQTRTVRLFRLLRLESVLDIRVAEVPM